MNEINRRRKESHYYLIISKIIQEELTNSNLGLVTVVDAKLSNDGSILKIFVVFDKHEQRGFEALNNAKGFIKSEFAKYINERKVPEIVFKLDTVSKSGQKIDQILKQIKEQENEK